MKNQTKVALVDDQLLVREALKILIESHDNGRYKIVGEAPDGLTAIRMALKIEPELILLDLVMPSMSGLDVIKEIRLRKPDTKIIALTTSESEQDIQDCMQAGVHGYVHKRVDKRELFHAMDSVMSGQAFTCSVSANKIRNTLANVKTNKNHEKASSALSEREKQVLKLVAEGHKNKEISEELYISVKTVEKHRANLKRKLKIPTTAGLIAYCLQEKII